MRDVDQLITAHETVIKFNRFQSQRSGTQTTTDFLNRLSDLVGPLTPGRPPDVMAINRAGIVLLSAHLEGFIEDLHKLAATTLLAGKVLDLDEMIRAAQRPFNNPNQEKVTALFVTIGMPEILVGISWTRTDNKKVRTRLDDFVGLRNRIAHGGQEPVHTERVRYWKRYVETLAPKLDAKVGREIARLTGTPPW